MRRASSIPVPAFNPAVSFKPRPDDVIVKRDESDGPGYRVAQKARRGRVETDRNEAIQTARSIAIRRAVDLWYCDGPTYRLLEVYRPRLS